MGLSFEPFQQFHLPLAGLSRVRVLAQGKVEDGAAFEDGLRVRELAEAPFAMVGAHAGVAHTVEWHALHHHVDADLVDTSAAKLLRLHGTIRPSHVLREQIHGQWMLAVSDGLHQRIHFGILEGHHRQQRTEKLVPHDMLVLIDGEDEGGGVATRFAVALAAEDDAVAVFIRQRRAFVVCRRCDEFRVFRIGDRMLADLRRKCLLEFLQERLRDLLGHGYLVDVDADLSGVAELEEGDLAGCVFEVGILAHHAPIAGLAAQLQRHGGEVLGGFGHHVLAHGGRAGVEDLVEALREAHVRHVVAAVDEGDVLGRENFREEALEHFGAGRRLAAGFDHHSVAAAHRRRHHADGQQYREVERADHQRHAVGHLIDFGDGAGEAHQSAEMAFRPCPAAQPAQHLVDFHDDGTHVAEVSLHAAASEVGDQRVLELGGVLDDRRFQFLKLLLPPFDRQRRARAEELALRLNDSLDLFVCI